MRLRTACLLIPLVALGCKRTHVINQARASTALTRPARAIAPPEAQGGDGEQQGRGAGRWRDTGVYLDGKPIGVLGFGELPISLKPVWIEQEKSAEIEPGSHAPGYVIVKQRRYRFTDYLQALGVPLSQVRELHVLGPHEGEAIVATGADLRSKRARDFMFRFGGGVGGKAIPQVPNGFGNDMCPDKITSVMIYVHKQPPKLTDDGFVLHGEVVSGVPYGGEPLHGGVRIYRDDKLVASLHRRDVVEREAESTDADGNPRYKLADVLKAEGVDLRGVVEAWVIRDERRKEKLTGAELEQLTFELGAKKQNAILLGDQKLQAQVLALHTRALRPDELPTITKEESDD